MQALKACLLPLAVVLALGWIPVWVSLGGSMATLGLWPKVLTIATPIVMVLVDCILFSRRAAQPGFDPWDEV